MSRSAAASASGLRPGAAPFTPRFSQNHPAPSSSTQAADPQRSQQAGGLSSIPCRFFLDGYCRRGSSCWYKHDAAASGRIAGDHSATALRGAGSAASMAVPEVCGICLEQPVTFGLLAACDHVFCLGCIRTWRDAKDKTEAIRNSRVTRLCPVCRTFSDIVIPSSFFLVGEDKVRAQAAYKESMLRTPCKYFISSNGATCPYGDECFFAHNDSNGQRVHVSRPQRRPRPNRSSERRSWTSVRDMLRDVFMFVQTFDVDNVENHLEFATWRTNVSRRFVASHANFLNTDEEGEDEDDEDQDEDEEDQDEGEEDEEEEEEEEEGEEEEEEEDEEVEGEEEDDDNDDNDDDSDNDSDDVAEAGENGIELVDEQFGWDSRPMRLPYDLENRYAGGMVGPCTSICDRYNDEDDDNEPLPLGAMDYSCFEGEELPPLGFGSGSESASESADTRSEDNDCSDGERVYVRPLSPLSAGEVESGEGDSDDLPWW